MFKTKRQDFYSLDFALNGHVIRVFKSRLVDNKIGVIEVTPLKKVGVLKTTKIIAFSLTCPHMGGDLSVGRCDVKNNILECPWHGYVYNVDNLEMVENPNVEIMKLLRVKSKCFDPKMEAPKLKLRSYKCSEELDDVLIHV